MEAFDLATVNLLALSFVHSAFGSYITMVILPYVIPDIFC
jgi:hypothetical protein